MNKITNETSYRNHLHKLNEENIKLKKEVRKLKEALTKAGNLPISDVSARLSASLGECVEGNDYEIVADKDGRFWINHKQIGSGEPLEQWIVSVLNVL